MRADHARDRLTTHQQCISDMLTEAQDALRDDPVNGAKTIAVVRWKLLRALREYQLFKHVEIFDPLIARGDAARCSDAKRLKSRCLAMAQSYSEHVARWSHAAPAGSWSAYSVEAQVMTERITKHLEDEAIGVARLLAGVGRTRIG